MKTNSVEVSLEQLKQQQQDIDKAIRQAEERRKREAEAATKAEAAGKLPSKVARIAQYLTSQNCEYQIKLPCGMMLASSLDNPPDKTRRRKPKITALSKYPRGVVTGHVRKFIESLSTPGVNSASIPVGEFDVAAIAEAAGKCAYALYGKGQVTTERRDNTVVVKLINGPSVPANS